MEQNPYAPTKAALSESPFAAADAGSGGLRLASKGRRFWNAVIDGIVCELVAGVAGAILEAVTGPAEPSVAGSLFGMIVGILVWLGYYVLMEANLGATVGKFVTGTRVVTESAERPSLGQIWKRTWIRAVPFEGFSFFGSRPGWHDRWSRTRVISIR